MGLASIVVGGFDVRIRCNSDETISRDLLYLIWIVSNLDLCWANSCGVCAHVFAALHSLCYNLRCRPDMVPYCDQRDTQGLIGLGLEWHPKMLFRVEISGTIVNPYHTPL